MQALTCGARQRLSSGWSAFKDRSDCPAALRDLRQLVRGGADALDGRARELGRAIDVLNPALAQVEDLEQELLSDQETFARFLASARAGRGPLLLECLTYRLRGHYEGDPAKYREAIAAKDWQEKDPIQRLRRRAIEEGALSEEDAAAIEREAAEAVEAAVEFARASPFPDPGLAEELTYA